MKAKDLEAQLRQMDSERSEFREALREEVRRVRDERDDLRRQVTELERQRDKHRDNALRQQENARSLGMDISELVGFDPTYEDGDGLRAAVAALVEERDDLRQRLTSTQKNALALGASVSAIVAERDSFREKTEAEVTKANHRALELQCLLDDATKELEWSCARIIALQTLHAHANERQVGERAKVAKWLRTTEDFDDVSDGDLMMSLSEAIERGDHE